MTKEPHIRLAVTPFCNFKCVYCNPRGEGEAPNGLMLSKDEITLIAKIAGQVGFKHVKFTGGEPLIRPDIIDIIKSVKDNAGLKTHWIITNGVFLQQKAQQLKDAGIDHVVVSLDTIDPVKLKELNRGKEGDLEKIIDGIAKCHEIGLPVTFNMVVMKNNLDQILGVSEIASKYKAKLKLIDLMNCNDETGFGTKNMWQEQFVDFDEVNEYLVPYSTRIDIESPIGNLGTTMKSYYLKNGATIIARDAKRGAFYHKTCLSCTNFPCQDAIYGARITHSGKLKQCLARNDNLVDLLPDLRAGRLDVVTQKMRVFYKVFADSTYHAKAWKPKISAVIENAKQNV